jgi:hypothetical protein
MTVFYLSYVWSLRREFGERRPPLPRAFSKATFYRDVTLNDWLTHLPPEFVKQHLNISQEVLDAIPAGNYAVLPR